MRDLDQPALQAASNALATHWREGRHADRFVLGSAVAAPWVKGRSFSSVRRPFDLPQNAYRTRQYGILSLSRSSNRPSHWPFHPVR